MKYTGSFFNDEIQTLAQKKHLIKAQFEDKQSTYVAAVVLAESYIDSKTYAIVERKQMLKPYRENENVMYVTDYRTSNESAQKCTT